jgi:hypothetical protein
VLRSAVIDGWRGGLVCLPRLRCEQASFQTISFTAPCISHVQCLHSLELCTFGAMNLPSVCSIPDLTYAPASTYRQQTAVCSPSTCSSAMKFLTIFTLSMAALAGASIADDAVTDLIQVSQSTESLIVRRHCWQGLGPGTHL